jgi:hypothetical protein
VKTTRHDSLVQKKERDQQESAEPDRETDQLPPRVKGRPAPIASALPVGIWKCAVAALHHDDPGIISQDDDMVVRGSA